MVGKLSWSTNLIRTPATTVIDVVTDAITTAAMRGFSARAISRSSRRSNFVSCATHRSSARDAPSPAALGSRTPLARCSVAVVGCCTHVLSRTLRRLHRTAFRAVDLVDLRDKVDAAFSSWFWPFLGLLFLPWTTLAYVIAWGPVYDVSGWGWLLVALGLAADIATYSAKSAQARYA